MGRNPQSVAIVHVASGRCLGPSGEWRACGEEPLLLSRDDARRWIDRFSCEARGFRLVDPAEHSSAA